MHNKSFSLSIQKQFQNKNIHMEPEVDKAFNELNFRTLLNRSSIKKLKGFKASVILYLLILLPFVKQRMSCFWASRFFAKQVEAQKDTFYRFLNNERFNWRKLLTLFASRVISKSGDVPLAQKTLIVDDTISLKTGKEMELSSYHFDHKSGKSVLGYQYLQLGYHNGTQFYPIDFAVNTASKRPNANLRDIDKRTNGFRRRKEAFAKRTDALINMIDRAWKNGFDASFVLFDSWFAHDCIISKIFDIGYGVICRLKRGRVKYQYNGGSYTLKQLYQEFAKKRTKYLPDFNVKAACLDVRLPKTGQIRIVFATDGKKQWHAFLSTDTSLEVSEILSYYAMRWSIEVFFKDAKQMLYLGKEQSKTFDAVISCYTIVIIRYLLLVHLLHQRQAGPIGPLFREISEEQVMRGMYEEMWNQIKKLLIVSSDIVSKRIDTETMLQLIDIIENVIASNHMLSTAKL